MSPAVMVRLVRALAVGIGLTFLAGPLASQGPDVGAIAGHIKLTRRAAGAPLPTNTYPARTVSPRAAPPVPEMRNVVVYLKNVVARGRVPTSTAELKQEDETFVPHVLAITKGSTVM